MIAMSIIASVAVVTLGFSAQGPRVFQILVCGLCLALRTAAVSGMLGGGEEIIYYAWAPALGGVVAALSGLRQWQFSIPINPLGCAVTAFVFILLGFFACWLIWIVGIAVVIIGCTSAIINGCDIKQRIVATIFLLLLLAPIATLAASWADK